MAAFRSAPPSGAKMVLIILATTRIVPDMSRKRRYKRGRVMIRTAITAPMRRRGGVTNHPSLYLISRESLCCGLTALTQVTY